MKTLKAVLAILILTVVPVAADDLGANLLSGEPVDTWAGITSNTAEIFGFYTARSRDYPNANQNTGDWSTTRTQWFEEGDTDTTQTLYRTRIHNWLQITNYTSRTLYISFNATYQSLLSGGTSHVVNETTPTLNTTTYQFRLDAERGHLRLRPRHRLFYQRHISIGSHKHNACFARTIMKKHDVIVAALLIVGFLTVYAVGEVKYGNTLGGTSVAGGSDTQVQYNDGGAFGGDSGMVYNAATNALTLLGPITAHGIVSVESFFTTNVVVGGTLDVVGVARFDNTVGSSLTITGGHLVSNDTLSVTNESTLSGTLYVGGAGTFGAGLNVTATGLLQTAIYYGTTWPSGDTKTTGSMYIDTDYTTETVANIALKIWVPEVSQWATFVPTDWEDD
jgi:hypothetical protein